MKIELWADFVCPYCMVGKHRLDEALANFEHYDQVEVVCRSFELDADRLVYSGQSLFDSLSAREGMTPEKAQRLLQKTVQLGLESGFEFNIEAIKPTNTHDAHRLCHFARTLGREEDLVHRIYAAYFLDGKVISDQDTLLDLASEAGMERAAALEILQDPTRFQSDVMMDQAEAQDIFFPVVPHFRINGKHQISAVPTLDELLAVMHQAAAEENLSK